MNPFDQKLLAFCTRLETEMNARFAIDYPSTTARDLAEGRNGHYQIGTDWGKRFVRYFVDRHTEIIFGAKGWKAYNPNREYGTLDTIDNWDWSGYYACSKNGQSTLVPKSQRK